MTTTASTHDARTAKLHAAIVYTKHSFEYVVELPKLSPNATPIADYWLTLLPTHRTFAETTDVLKSKTRYSATLVDSVVELVSQAMKRKLFDTDADFDNIVELALRDEEVTEVYYYFESAREVIFTWLTAARDSGPIDRMARADVLYRLRTNTPADMPIDGSFDLDRIKRALTNASHTREAVKRSARKVVTTKDAFARIAAAPRIAASPQQPITRTPRPSDNWSPEERGEYANMYR